MDQHTPAAKQPPKAPAFLWRLTVTLVWGAIWSLWFWVANQGQPLRFLPSEQDFVTLRNVSPWIWWGKSGIGICCILVVVFTKELRRNATAWGFLGFLGLVLDFVLCIFLGWLLLPWGLNLTLAAVILPVLSLVRPYRNWGLSLAVAVADFSALRLIYTLTICSAYPEEVLSHLVHGAGFVWWMWGLTVMYGIILLVVASMYLWFVSRSVVLYDPFPVVDENEQLNDKQVLGTDIESKGIVNTGS
jgi:hypothetical protein